MAAAARVGYAAMSRHVNAMSRHVNKMPVMRPTFRIARRHFRSRCRASDSSQLLKTKQQAIKNRSERALPSPCALPSSQAIHDSSIRRTSSTMSSLASSLRYSASAVVFLTFGNRWPRNRTELRSAFVRAGPEKSRTHTNTLRGCSRTGGDVDRTTSGRMTCQQSFSCVGCTFKVCNSTTDQPDLFPLCRG